MKTKRRVPQQLKKAFAALVAFAKKNFPAKGRLKHVVVLEISPSNKVIVGGGKIKKTTFTPGLWHVWNDDEVGYSPSVSGDIPLLTPRALYELLSDKHREMFLREARRVVDF